MLNSRKRPVDEDTCSVFLLRAVDDLRRYLKGELQQRGHVLATKGLVEECSTVEKTEIAFFQSSSSKVLWQT